MRIRGSTPSHSHPLTLSRVTPVPFHPRARRLTDVTPQFSPLLPHLQRLSERAHVPLSYDTLAAFATRSGASDVVILPEQQRGVGSGNWEVPPAVTTSHLPLPTAHSARGIVILSIELRA